MNYWPSIVKMYPDNHVLQIFLSCYLSFPSLSPITSLIIPINDSPVLMDFTFGCQAGTISKLRLTSDIPKLSPPHDPQSTLLCTTLYSSVVIDIDNYLDTYH